MNQPKNNINNTDNTDINSTNTNISHRRCTVNRQTTETDIKLTINLDGSGKYEIDTGVGFLDHMLCHIARHGRMDLSVTAHGDTHIDDHHTVEDIAICLGQAVNTALADKKGIVRFGSALVPMEDALAQVAIDICGRAYCVYLVEYTGSKIGNFDVELIEEFLRSFASNARINLHITVPYGTNNHHIAEAVFKALGRALHQATSIDSRYMDIPSTKGTL